MKVLFESEHPEDRQTFTSMGEVMTDLARTASEDYASKVVVWLYQCEYGSHEEPLEIKNGEETEIWSILND